ATRPALPLALALKPRQATKLANKTEYIGNKERTGSCSGMRKGGADCATLFCFLHKEATPAATTATNWPEYPDPAAIGPRLPGPGVGSPAPPASGQPHCTAP